MALINSITALELIGVSGGDINASVFTATDSAVRVRQSSDNRFHANRLGGLDGDACHRGYHFTSSSYNIVTGSEIAGCDGESGVVFAGSGGVGSTGNIVRGNLITVSANFGVIAAEGSTGNIVQANRVSGSREADLRDLSGSCDSNTWKANQFATATPSCLK